MSDLKDVKTWRTELGLLPVPLFATDAAPGAYVLLNGTRGSFCLYLGHRSPDSRSQAWSANVGHSISFLDNEVLVQRWDEEPPSEKRHRISDVCTGLEEFHRSLERETPPTERSIVAHALGVFRRLRAALYGAEGGEALKAFLYLLASAIEWTDRSTVDLEEWQLSEDAKRLALTLDKATWDALVNEMINGHRLDKLRPDLSLTLRHASGILFQEAHYAAIFDSPGQTLLPGFMPRPISVGSSTSAVGLHFTPPAIVRTIVEEAIKALLPISESVTIFDPACGSGEFLRESLRQLRLTGYSGHITLLGFDISEAACAMARFVLAWEARGIDTGLVTIRIDSANALADETSWPESVDAVLMNPPFQSWQDMSPAWRQTVARVLGDLSRNRPDLAAAFLWKSLGSLGSNGVIGAILPSPFLDGVSFGSLRDQLADNLETLLVARLGSHSLFYEATVDACFYIGRRGPQEAVPVALWASHRQSSTSAALRTLRRLRAHDAPALEPFTSEAEGFSVYPNPDIGKREKPWAPRPFKEWQFSRRVAGLPRVGDQFTVRQGTLTGLNRAFVLEKAEWLRLPKEERPYFRPCVFHETLRAGRVFDEAYVFYPYGSYSIQTESELKSAVPAFYRDHLREHKAALLARPSVDHWWLLTRPRAWQVKPMTKLVTKYFGEAGSFAWDSDGTIVVVQGYSWIPKPPKGFGSRLWLAYLAIANSDTFVSLLAAHSNHVSGGQWNLSKRFVEKVPLPTLYSDQIRESRLDLELAAIGKIVHGSGLDSLELAQRERLNELAEASYLIEGANRNAEGE